IELAATRLKVLSLEQLAAKLDERFRLLTGGSRTALPRQQTMRALIDWSYDLLSENEKTVFRRVSVFAGGCTLDAAGDVCSDERIESWDILDVVAALVEKSMVVAELGDADQRYRLLESTRQYALEKLLESGAQAHLRERHAAYMVKIAERAACEIESKPMGGWIAELAPELDNFRLALDWFITERQNVERGAHLVALLFELLVGLSRTTRSGAGANNEVWRWCEHALEALGPDASPHLRAPLMNDMSVVSSSLGKGLTQRRDLAREGLELFRAANDRKGIAKAMLSYGSQLVFFGEGAQGRPLLAEALEIARTTGDRRLIAHALALDSYANDDIVERRLRMKEAIGLFRAAGDELGSARTLSWLAEHEFRAGNTTRALENSSEAIIVLRRRRFRANLTVQLMNSAAYNIWLGNFQEARDRARESMGICQEIQDHLDIPICIQHLAYVAAETGDARVAARLTGFADARFIQIDEPRQGTEQISTIVS
ncbi:MAG: hypothetical protein M3R35_05380, partial [Candidatus Eremiobacteraeota bacterium]|nr:hypothetical protein [Candidatus Eremiobacteraeota bacterium]